MVARLPKTAMPVSFHRLTISYHSPGIIVNVLASPVGVAPKSG
jgi:hypothetical protein